MAKERDALRLRLARGAHSGIQDGACFMRADGLLQWRELSPHGVSMSHRVFTLHRDRVLAAWWANRDADAAKAEVSLQRKAQPPVKLLRKAVG